MLCVCVIGNYCKNNGTKTASVSDFAAWRRKRNGKLVTKVKGAVVLAWLRACLGAMALHHLDVRNLERYNLKSYRVGRATEMASQGSTCGDTQLAGRWSSKTAPFFYTNTNIADRAQEPRMIVEQDFAENELDGGMMKW